MKMKEFVVLVLPILGLLGCQSTAPTSDDNMVIKSAVENRNTIKPIIMITAMYPDYEFQKGIEGSCKVSFDLIDQEKFGSAPTNVKPLQCSNPNFFSACEKALTKWRFKELSDLDNSESPIGLQYTCNFELERT
jgi:hypothetical protein